MGLRLLCVTAHPDDECFAFGGALALAAEAGVESCVVCLTDGQAGSYRGTAATPEELGDLRRQEFAASCRVLGVSKYEMLHHRDGQLEFADFSKLAAEIVERIRAFRPQLVLTFGGEGGLNTHPDHTIVSAATTAAFHWAGAPKRYPEAGQPYQPQKLFHLTGNFFIPERRPPLLAPWTLTLDIRSVFEKKMAAFREHASQAPLVEQTRDLFLEHGAQERYALAAALEPQPAQQTTSMFDGVSPDP